MLQNHSHIPSHPSSIKKMNHSLINSLNHLSKEIPHRSKSNAHSFSTSKKHHNCPSGKNNFYKSNSFSKQFEHVKDQNHLNQSINFKSYDSNHSFNSAHMNISFINSNKNHHIESSSYLISHGKDEHKSKEKKKQGLKINYSQNKIKLKKVLTVKIKQNYSLSKEILKNYNDQEKGITIEDKIQQIVLAKRKKKDQPLKLYTEGNTNQNSPNPNESATMINASNLALNYERYNTTSDNCHVSAIENTLSSSDMINVLNDLDQKLIMKLNQNKTNSKTKKYNSIREIFEKMIKVIRIEQRFLLLKLYTGYHEVVLSFANENKNLKKINTEVQNHKAHIDDNNKLKEKDKEINALRKKVAEYEKNLVDQGVFSKSTNMSTQMNPPISSNEIELYTLETEMKNNYITDINKRNLEDLDALYFYDKVQMNANNSHHAIPVLDLQVKEEQYHATNKENLTKGIYKNILEKFKNNSNPTILNVKKK